MRPGLALGWGEAATPTPPPGTTLALHYQLHASAGFMHLRHVLDRRPSLVLPDGFQAVIFLSAERVDEMLAPAPSAGSSASRRLATDASIADFAHPLPPRARLALESIRRCPFAGVCRDMALTARCHDLLVEFLTAWTAALQPAPVTTIGPDDRVRLAAELLERDLAAPPSLADLAAQVGLSETTLKRHFPVVHGHTAFSYLRVRRMEKARQLLETGAATVLEAATLVGYSNPSNFAAAFRQQFGVNPKTFQLRARRPG